MPLVEEEHLPERRSRVGSRRDTGREVYISLAQREGSGPTGERVRDQAGCNVGEREAALRGP
jgi:hypothetical protein